jgi:hypothetical protein
MIVLNYIALRQHFVSRVSMMSAHGMQSVAVSSARHVRQQQLGRLMTACKATWTMTRSVEQVSVYVK